MRPYRAVVFQSTSTMAIAHFQRVSSSSLKTRSLSMARLLSITGSSNQTPLSSSRENRSRSTMPPAAS